MTKFRNFLSVWSQKAASARTHLGNFCTPVLKAFYIVYPIVVVATALILLPRASHAGVIRKIILSPNKPGVINLAYGNATAVSFQTKPEKLVPGSPQKVEINFLGKDITVSPIGPAPGNLIVYTSGNRYVLLFRIVPEAQHDDVVEIVSAKSTKARPIRLDEDSYSVKKITITLKPRNWKEAQKKIDFDVLAYQDRLIGGDFVDFLGFHKGLRCERCVIRMRSDEKALICQAPIRLPIDCRSEQYKELLLQGSGP